MRTELYWIDGPWPGRLAIMPRPRGADWLEDEVQSWRRAGVDVVLSLLTPDERTELGLDQEGPLCRANRIEFQSFPIADRAVPSSMAGYAEQVAKLAEHLANARTVAVHCRQGIGRAALLAIGLLVMSGVGPEAATQQVGKARGCTVPETSEQRRWIADYAKTFVIPLPK